MSKKILSQARLKELLRYDPETGYFTWLVTRSRKAMAGQRAGSPDTAGYVQIIVEGHPYRAHRLAWFYMHGEWPAVKLDHRNCVRNDNAFSNLREVSDSQNAENQRRARSDNQCGLLGVSPLEGKWAATIQVNGKKIYLGRFATPEEAHSVYLAKKREIHTACTL